MATSSLSNKVRNVQFNVSGIEAIVEQQKLLIKNKQLQIELAKKEGKDVTKLQKEYNTLDTQLKKYCTDMNDVRKTIENLGEASPRQIAKLNAAFKRLSTTMSSMSEEAQTKLQELLGKVAPVTQAMADEFKKGFTDMTKGLDLGSATYSQLNNFVQTFVKEGRDLALVAEDDAKAYAKMGENATNAKVRMAEMEGVLVSTTSATKEQLQNMIKFYQEMQKFQGATARQKEMFKSNEDSAKATLANRYRNTIAYAGLASVKDLEEAVSWLQKYQSEAKVTSVRQNELTASIKAGQEALKQKAQTNQLRVMRTQFAQLDSISKDALNDQLKFWQTAKDGASTTSPMYDEAKTKLAALNAQLEKRNRLEIEEKGNATLQRVQKGAYSQTTDEIQKQIDALTKWRSVVEQKKGNPQQVQDIDNAIRQLNQDLVNAQENVKLAKQYLDDAKSGKPFQGTVQDLQKVRQGLVEMREKLTKIGDTKGGIRKLNNQILKVDQDIKTAGLSAKRFEEIVSNPKKAKASLTELQMSYEKLKLQIQETGKSQEAYQRISRQMSAVKKQMDELNGSAAKQKGLSQGLITNIKNIVLHYIGLQVLFQKLINTLKDVVKLSDLMTNVQKVTNMTTGEVDRLTRSLQELDTRASTEKLMEFAEQAGKLGVYAERGAYGMKQFVEMGEMISRTLGEDIGGAKAIADLAKVNDILKVNETVLKRTENEMTVMRDALNATGSAILNVGNNSAAGYAAIVDYVGRVGAIGATAQMSATDIVALGGTLDALKMPAEAGATALSQFIAAIQRRTDEMARAAKLDVLEFREAVATDMVGAIRMLTESVGEGTASAQDLMDAMSGRSKSNVNVRNVINLLALNTNLLNKELKLAREGFDSALEGGNNLSIMEREFQRTNENTAGGFERLGNMIQEVFVNPTTEKWMHKLADALKWYVEYLYAVVNDFNVFEKVLAGVNPLIGALIKNLHDASGELKYMDSIIDSNIENLKDETREADTLFAMLRHLNLSEGERGRLISEINNKYGTMLGFMLDEQASAREIANAYKLVVAQLKEKVRIQAKEEALTRATRQANDNINNANETMFRGLEDVFGGDTARAAKLNTLLQAYVEQIATEMPDEKDFRKIRDKAIAQAAKQLGISSSAIVNSMKGKAAMSGLTSFVQGVMQRNSAETRVMSAIDKSGLASSILLSEDALKERNFIVADKLNKFIKSGLKNKKAADIKDMMNVLDEVLKMQGMDKLKGQAAVNMKNFQQWRDQMQKTLEGRSSIYGNSSTSTDLKNMDAKQLQKLYADLQTALSFEQDNVEWSRIMPGMNVPGLVDGMSREAAHATLDAYSEELKAEAERRHIALGGNGPTWRHPSDGGGRKKTEKELLDEARKHLEQYYKEREERATIALNNGEVLESEYNRFIFANQQELLTNQQILEEKFIDHNKKFTTDAVNEWMKSITGVDGEVITINYEKIEAFLADKGKHLIGGIQNNAQKYGAQIQANLKKQRDEIDKILMEDRPIAKLAQDFMDDLNNLQLMFTEWKGTEMKGVAEANKEAAHRLSFLMEEAKKGYALSAEEFINDMKNEGFTAWADSLSEDTTGKLQALLLKVQSFTALYEDAVKKMQDRLAKRFEQQLKTIGDDGTSFNSRLEAMQRKLENIKLADERRQHSQSQADSWGLTGHNLAGVGDSNKLQLQALEHQKNAELELYKIELERYNLLVKTNQEDIQRKQAEVDAMEEGEKKAQLENELAALKQIAMNNERAQADKLAESWRSVEQAQVASSQGHLDLLSNAISQAQPYYENMMSFAESFGENIFGSKEARQEAARDLLKSVIKTTGQMLTQWLVYISTKRLYDKMEIAQEQAKQYQLLLMQQQFGTKEVAAHATAVLAKMGIDSAEQAKDAIKAQSKEAAKAGWAGWAIGAGLSVLMNMLFNAAASKVRSAAAAAGANTGVGTLGTGMLTYAEGKYGDVPTYRNAVAYDVDAADGRRYNATYAGRLQTGVYHKPHFAVFSEQGDEMVIDHPTLVETARQAPWLLKGIQDIHRYGRLVPDYGRFASATRMLGLSRHGVRTYADGNIEDVMGGMMPNADASGADERLMDVLSMVGAALDNLSKNPVHVNMYGGKESIDYNQKKLNSWKKMNGLD